MNAPLTLREISILALVGRPGPCPELAPGERVIARRLVARGFMAPHYRQVAERAPITRYTLTDAGRCALGESRR